MTRYAETTTVTAEKSRAEIERTLTRYGADQFMYGWEAGAAVIAFRANGKMVRFMLPLPTESDVEYTPGGRWRPYSQRGAALEQATKQRWRALALVVKAKLEAVEAGIVTFEDEFMAHILLPGGGTVSEWMRPQIDEAYATGLMPSRLPMLPERSTVLEEVLGE